MTISGHKQERTLKQFSSIEKIDTGILYTLELTSSISVLLLAFGLIASMAGTIIRTFRSYAQRQRVKYVLYGFLSVLLLFTAIWIRSLAIVLLIVAHALRHVQSEPQQHTLPVTAAPESVPLVLTVLATWTIRSQNP